MRQLKWTLILTVILFSCLTTGQAQIDPAGAEFYILPGLSSTFGPTKPIEILNLRSGVINSLPLTKLKQQMSELVWLRDSQVLAISSARPVRLFLTNWANEISMTDLGIKAQQPQWAISPNRKWLALIYQPFVKQSIGAISRGPSRKNDPPRPPRPATVIRLYQLEPFGFSAMLKGDYDPNFIALDDQGRIGLKDYFSAEAQLWSLGQTSQLLARLTPTGDWLEARGGRWLSVERQGQEAVYGVTELLTGKTRGFNFPQDTITVLTQDGAWLIGRCYDKKRNTDSYSFNGRIILFNLSNEKQLQLNLEPQVLNTAINGKTMVYNNKVLNDNMISRPGYLYFISPTTITAVELTTGKIVNRPLVRR